MRLLTAAEARQLDSTATAAAPRPQPVAECLQAGLFTPEQTTALRAGLESSLPIGSWSLESSTEPGRWIVYMGKYTSDDALAKKRSELRGLGVSFEPSSTRRWGRACRWATMAHRPKPNAGWPVPPRAACAPPRWCWSAPKPAASC
jgi:hypothetical protein